MQTAWPLNVVTFLQSIYHKSIYIKVAQFLDEGFKTLILGLDFQSFKSLIEALYCLLLIHIAFAEAGKEIVIHLWTTNCFPIPRTCSGRGFDKISSLTGMPKNSTGVFYKYMKGNMFNSQDGGVYFLRIPPCILHACMMKSIWIVTRSYCISFPFLFFSFFFPYFINTQNCLLKNVSFGYILYHTVDRNFAYVNFNIVKQKGIIWRTRSKLIQRSKRQWQSVPRKL